MGEGIEDFPAEFAHLERFSLIERPTHVIGDAFDKTREGCLELREALLGRLPVSGGSLMEAGHDQLGLHFKECDQIILRIERYNLVAQFQGLLDSTSKGRELSKSELDPRRTFDAHSVGTLAEHCCFLT